MNYIDFSNRQNRDIRIEDLSKEYLDLIINAAKNDYSSDLQSFILLQGMDY